MSVTYPRETLPLFRPASVAPALAGFQGHTPTCALVSGQIPPGMLLDPNCTVSGTPVVQGTYGFTLRVSAAGVSNTLNFTGSIGVQGPGIQYQPSTVALAQGSPVSSTPNLSWWPSPLPGALWQYSVVSGALAPGLALDPASGSISGTLTTQGSFTAQVAALLTTAAGTYQTLPTTFSAAVDVPSFSYPASANSNAAGDSVLYLGLGASFQPSTDAQSTLGSFALIGGSLPQGLSLDGSTGVISGYPSAVSTTTSFQVEATATRLGVGNQVRAGATFEVRVPGSHVYPNGNAVRANATFNTISPTWQRDPQLWQPLSLTTSFAPKPGHCALPAGVAVDPYGRVDGHPTQTGTFSCTVIASNVANGVLWTEELSLSLEVN